MQVLWNGTMRCAPALSMRISLINCIVRNYPSMLITEIKKNTKGRGVTSNADSATVAIYDQKQNDNV